MVLYCYRQSIMNWSYIAGFFDGEGSLWFARASTGGGIHAQITIGQSSELVLQKMAAFLVGHGILAKVSQRKKQEGNLQKKEFFVLYVTNLINVRKFLEGVMPYLVVKKVGAQDVLRYMRLYPAFTPQQRGRYAREESKRRKTAVI